MIPVIDSVITPLSIDPLIHTYESNEIRFIRKSWQSIEQKAQRVYEARYDHSSSHFPFLLKTCCDFRRLEQACQAYLAQNLSPCP